MKCVVADLVVRTHRENRLPGCFESSAMKLAVCEARRARDITVRALRCQLCRERLSDDICYR